MKTDNVSSDNYKGTALEKSFQTVEPMSFEKAEQIIKNNFERKLIDKDCFDKAMEELDIIKGKHGVIGEIRTWSGVKYKKTSKGWEKVVDGGRLNVKKYNTVKMTDSDLKILEENNFDPYIPIPNSLHYDSFVIMKTKDNMYRVIDLDDPTGAERSEKSIKDLLETVGFEVEKEENKKD